jgi:myo-inositol 2-dehydrogenase / D-chiro-inositol 1-dehydrogenase
MSIRIGFIGVGGIATDHLINLLRLPEAEVVALCDLSLDQIQAARQSVNQHIMIAAAGMPDSPGNARAARLLDAVPYDDYRAMLRNEQLDLVYLCLPPFAHGDPEEAVISARLPMLVEKPVALDVSVAGRILQGIRRHDLLAASGYQTRYTAHLQRARELLAGRTIGMILALRFGQTPTTSWYHLQRKSGGQVIEMATHQIDMLRYLVGEVTTVYAAAATRINHKDQPDYDIFDVNCSTLTFDNGAVGTFATNFISGHGSPPDARGLHIFCDGMTLSLGTTLRAIFADRTEEIALDTDALFAEDQAFVRAVATHRPELIRSDYTNGLRTLAVTIANDRSARSGHPVNVPQLLAAEAPGI